MGILIITVGALSIIGAIFGRNFHAADVITLAEFKQKSSAWSGRLVFLLVGAGLITIGIRLLMEGR